MVGPLPNNPRLLLNNLSIMPLPLIIKINKLTNLQPTQFLTLLTPQIPQRILRKLFILFLQNHSILINLVKNYLIIIQPDPQILYQLLLDLETWMRFYIMIIHLRKHKLRLAHTWYLLKSVVKILYTPVFWQLYPIFTRRRDLVPGTPKIKLY